ncbi:acid protease [Mycena alexandri]|uniref:Acid protease n=1 Tax=Mycena alexandri TaxID=1745969 RepID=A0AAD6S969_9AGAR|nr:acid protease [Mycena alexandri]
MSQNSMHSVCFKTKVVKAQHMKHHDWMRAKHFLAGHHPHGPAAFHARKGRHHHEMPSSGDASKTVTVMDAGMSFSLVVGVTYLATVGVGSPATDYQLLIDTGSSNTWVSAVDKPFKSTSTCQDTRKTFNISYGKGTCSGNEYMDCVTLGPGLVIEKQLIGVADNATDMDGMDGILGIGPVDLTTGTMGSSDECIPTVTDNLVKQKTIPSACIGICYEPTTTDEPANGCLSFGGPDSSKQVSHSSSRALCSRDHRYTGDLDYVPITKKSPASNYWGIEQSVSYGGQEIMAKCSGISDTGTTLCMLPSSVFKAYQKMTGAILDKTTDLLTVTEDQYNSMQSMMFKIGGVEYELTKNAQIWPRCMNNTLGADPSKIYLIFADMGEIDVGDGLCFINGFTFLQRFYSVYDTAKQQVGFATTQYTTATTN